MTRHLTGFFPAHTPASAAHAQLTCPDLSSSLSWGLFTWSRQSSSTAMNSPLPFRKCHLHILRSLYAGQERSAGAARERRAVGVGAPPIAAARGGHAPGVDEPCASGCTEANENAETEQGCKSEANDTNESDDNGNDSEGLVSNETWDLIERFLRRRMEYRPLKERRIRWANISSEAQSRLDRSLSVTSADPDKQVKMPSRLSSLTPRSPLFSPSVSGRGSIGSMTPCLSLTPQSSNRNAPALSQNEREIASTIPAWTFINRMLQRRSKLCTESCQAFRSQPFFAELRNEAEMRCEILKRVLKRLKLGSTRKQDHNVHIKKRVGSGLTICASGKRQKLGTGAPGPTIPSSSSFGHFNSDEYSQMTKNDLDDECCLDENAIVETQMKLCLWSSLLSSVKEIVDES